MDNPFAAWHVLAAAVAMDLAIGDPRRLPHPVRWMGGAIAGLEPVFRRRVTPPFLSGLLFATGLIAAAWAAGLVVVAVAERLHPLAGFGVQAVMLFYCLSARSLAAEAGVVRDRLADGDVEGARGRLAGIVGRDVTRLDERGISRAAVETVAENLVDGFVSPLFFAALGGAPLALAYKMTNTLDSMVGYKNETYRLFGRAAARIDDAANFVPARLSVAAIGLAVALLSGDWRRTVATAWREGRRHSSPNAGFSEAAFAGALAIRLGGPNVYHGRLVEKPHIGAAFGDATAGDIEKACRLMLVTAMVWTALACAAAAMIR